MLPGVRVESARCTRQNGEQQPHVPHRGPALTMPRHPRAFLDALKFATACARDGRRLGQLFRGFGDCGGLSRPVPFHYEAPWIARPRPLSVRYRPTAVDGSAAGFAAAPCVPCRENPRSPAMAAYIHVPDLRANLATCERLSGTILVPPRGLDGNHVGVTRDPAGAAMAHYQVG
jgi:hypothetical protein